MPALLAIFFGFLSRMLMTRVGFYVIAAMSMLGLSLVSQNLVVAPIMTSIASSFTGMPAITLQWLSYIGVDKFMTTVMSAYAAVATTRALRLRAIAR